MESDSFKDVEISVEQLEKEIPNYRWYMNLKPGDEAIVFFKNVSLYEISIPPCGYILTKVVENTGDGYVTTELDLGPFYNCRIPGLGLGIIGLIPLKPEYLAAIRKDEIVMALEMQDWDLSLEKLEKILRIIEKE